MLLVLSVTSFFGDGSSLSGISVDSTSLKDSGGNIKVQQIQMELLSLVSQHLQVFLVMSLVM